MRILNDNYEENLFQSIEILRLQYFHRTPITFLSDLIGRFPNATTLQVRCSSFETLFPLEETGHCSIKIPTKIKNLWLFQLEQLEHIWDDNSPTDALVLNLEDLTVRECSMLMRLAPPLASFIKLTSLEVEDCNGLMYFMTSFTAKSLVHLTSLTVSNCGKLEEIVMTNREESEEEIKFESLKYLELNSLSSFKSFCCGKHIFIFPSLLGLKVTRCHKMQNFSCGFIVAPFLKFVEVENRKKCWKESLNITIKQMFLDKAIVEEVERDNEESSSSSQRHETSASTSRASSSEEHGAQSKANKIVDLGKQQIHKLPIPHSGIVAHKMHEIIQLPLDQVSQNTLSLPKVDAAFGAEEMNETLQTPFAEAVENTLTHTSIQETDIRTQKMHETFKTPPFQAAQNEISPIMAHNTEESNDSKIVRNENLSNLATTFVIGDTKQAIGTQDIDETIDKDGGSLSKAQNSGSTGSDKSPFLGTLPNESLPSQTSNYTEYTATIDPSTSRAPEAMTSSMLASDADSNYKWMVDISVQNLPYLEAGLNCHPQVLDWLNTKRQRVFASLFADVSRILRTTRRRDLTKDDRNHIRDCCIALKAVGFDGSWLSYVHGCIESCVDGDELNRKLEEAEAKASTLRTELVSVEASLVSLRDEASRLDHFIEP
ncbi:uncharacterized protein LOC129322207 [Prosopis cineraria]|uniref:uncharacterized protein LOC129322207 n=1 Tax=Prosopis cineraria TaxID=364024 RepID=UPI00240FF7FB|nr:uncharacterized protein LOC129322207 [Prosopis cineraria]